MPIPAIDPWFPWPQKQDEKSSLSWQGRSLTRAGLLDSAGQLCARLRSAGIRRGHVVASLLPGSPDMVACLLGVPQVATLAPLNPSLTDAEVRACLDELGASALITPQGIQNLDPRPEDSSLYDAALILFTSATTGKPKQVPLSFANLHAMMEKTGSGLALGPSDRLLSFMPLFHLQGILSVLAQLRAGGRVVLMPRYDPLEFPAWLDHYRPTWYTAGPAIHNAVLQHGLPHPPGSLRLARSSGAQLPAGRLRRLEELLQAPVLEAYGLTESGSVTQNPLPPGVRKPGSAGVPFGVEVRLLPSGEIAIRGPSVMRGYRHDDAANREAFLDGWFRTGDLGCFDADGYLYITGRLKEMINRGGEKVSPSEVDEALAAHPLVREAAAFGLPHPTLGEDVAAAVVLEPGAILDARVLREHAARSLAPHKIPRRIFFVQSLPKGATGKPRRHQLATAFSAVKVARVAPRSPLEAELAKRWSSRLGCGEIGVQTDWYHLGGDSLGLVRMAAGIEMDYGLPAGTLEGNGFPSEPTIERLAQCLSAPRLASSVLRFHPQGSKTPLFCLPGVHGSLQYLEALAESIDAARPVFLLHLPASEPAGPAAIEEAALSLIRQIRELRPSGPYFLAGHCYGGILAWEIASRLDAAGAGHGVLVLFDAPVPGYPRPLESWPAYLRRAAALAGEALRGGARRVLAQALDHFRYLQRLRSRRRRAAALRQHPEIAPDAGQAVSAFARLWSPRPLAWEVVSFLARQETGSTQVLEDPRLAWRHFARGRFSSIEADGSHNGMFAGPCAAKLAARLSNVLDSFDPKRAGPG